MEQDSNIRQKKWFNTKATFFILPLLFFSLPISSTAKSIFLAVAVLTLLVQRNFFFQFKKLLGQTWWGQAVILFLMFSLLACAWSPADAAEKWSVLGKYSKLIYLPILAVGFQSAKIRKLAIHAFLAAMAISAALSLLKFSGLLTFDWINADAVFRNHIMSGIMMSYAAYLAGYFLLKKQGNIRIVYALLFLLYSYQVLFISIGRTGYFNYLLLLTILILQIFTKKQALAGLLVICTLFTGCYILSPVMQDGIHKIIQNWQHFQQNGNTSVGYRLQFHNYAQQLFAAHPLIGNGTGSFTHLFNQTKPVPSWPGILLEPHSQYWLIAAEFGLIGLLCLVLLFWTLFTATYRLPATGRFAVAILLSFIIGNISDSLLFYSGSGYFFILWMALCLGETLELTPPLSLPANKPGYQFFIKRAFDFSVAFFLLILFSPLLLITALLIKIKLGSPILFRQVRPGLHGKPFQMIKFRTMLNNVTKDGILLPDEERQVPFGRLLRSTSIDELPELWNVLKGEMSLVGPRPLLMEYLPLYNNEQMQRHAVKPGITGWAQVNGRNALSWHDKFTLDNWYVNHLSFWLDLKILFLTIKQVIYRHGIQSLNHVTMEKFTGNSK